MQAIPSVLLGGESTVFPRNLAAPRIITALEMMLRGKGSIKFKVLVMQIRTGSTTRAIPRMTKNLKYKQAILNSKLSLPY